MAEIIYKEQIPLILEKINREFDVYINSDNFMENYIESISKPWGENTLRWGKNVSDWTKNNIDEVFRRSEWLIKENAIELLTDIISHQLNIGWTTDTALKKLKRHSAEILKIDPNTITGDSELNRLFPLNNRRNLINKLNKSLGHKMDILRPKKVMSLIVIIVFISVIPLSMIYNWKVGFLILVMAIFLFSVLRKTANSFIHKTVGNLADSLAWNDYLSKKNNPAITSREVIQKRLKPLYKDYVISYKSDKRSDE